MSTYEYDPAIKTAMTVVQAGQIALNGIETAIRPYKLSLTGWLILDYLSRQEEPIRQYNLRRFGNSKPNTTEVINTLCANDFAYRRDDPSDGRCKMVGILPDGRNLIEDSTPTIHQAAAHILEPLTISEAAHLDNSSEPLIRAHGRALWLPS